MSSYVALLLSEIMDESGFSRDLLELVKLGENDVIK